MSIKISILIPSIQSRKDVMSELVAHLSLQCGNLTGFNLTAIETCDVCKLLYQEVEIIVAVDDKQITTGAKRQLLMQAAKGEYVIFIDDDDIVPLYYIRELLIASKSDADCFAINGVMTTDGAKEIKWYLAKDNPNKTVLENGTEVYLRTTNHITAVKRSIALKSSFPDKSNAEDKGYSDGLAGLLKTEYKIDLPMYHYKYSTHNKEYK